jgi:hypothetical protein
MDGSLSAKKISGDPKVINNIPGSFRERLFSLDPPQPPSWRLKNYSPSRGSNVLFRVAMFAILLLICKNARADIFATFENFHDSEALTTQIAGVQFTNALVVSSSISLNEADFPPHSGDNVVFDNGGPIGLIFDSNTLGGSVFDFSAYFTFVAPLTLTAFNSSNSAIATVHSAFSNNTGTGGEAGSSPNELLQLTSSDPISSIVITGDLNGSSFTMDDLTVEIGTSAITIPEPRAVHLLSMLLPWVLLAHRFFLKRRLMAASTGCEVPRRV